MQIHNHAQVPTSTLTGENSVPQAANLQASAAEFVAPATQMAPINAVNASTSDIGSLLDSLKKLIQSLAPSKTTPLEEIQNDQEISYADSLSDFEYSNMTTTELRNTARLTPGNGNVMRLENRNGAVISADRFEAALKLAAREGFTLDVNGEVNVSRSIRVQPTGDLSVDARGATFVAAEGLAGDMISIDGASSPVPGTVHIEWNGGTFDASGGLNASSAAPNIGQFTSETNANGDLTAAARRRAARQGNESTSDALSIRGVVNGDQRIDTANVTGVKMIGLPVEDITVPVTQMRVPSGEVRDSWRDAGGDSGVFIQGLDEANVTNSSFFGIRDAAIYLTASPPVDGASPKQHGRNYTAEGNTIINAFDGISSKRGADNVTISDNTLTDVVVGLSIKETAADTVARNVTIDNNSVTRTSRGILIEDASGVTITNNSINELGREVAGERTIRNASQSRFAEAIALEGLTGSNNISDNTINRSNSASSGVGLASPSGVGGIVFRDHDSRFPNSDAEGNSIAASRLLPGGNSANTFNGFDNDTGNRVIDQT